MKHLILAALLLVARSGSCATINVGGQTSVTLNTGDELQINFTLDHFFAVGIFDGLPHLQVGQVDMDFLSFPPPNARILRYPGTNSQYYEGYTFDLRLSNGTTSYSSQLEQVLGLGSFMSGTNTSDGDLTGSWRNPYTFQNNSQTITLLNTGLPITFGFPAFPFYATSLLLSSSVDPISGSSYQVSEHPSSIFLQTVPEPATVWVIPIGMILLYSRYPRLARAVTQGNISCTSSLITLVCSSLVLSFLP
jgi:hypothetical protein